MHYRLTEKAVEDIEGILRYTFENWGERQTVKYGKLLFSQLDLLCINPLKGEAQEYLSPKVRKLKVDKHLVFYAVEEAEEVINVLRVLHANMDIEGMDID